MPQKFYKFICRKDNFLDCHGKNVLHPKVSHIITNFLNEDPNRYKELRNNLSKYKDIFHYVYSIVIPVIYCPMKSKFHIMFKNKDKRTVERLGKNSISYEGERDETCL